MTWKSTKRTAQKPKAHLAQCANCLKSCPHGNHYTPDGHCVTPKCGCDGFKSKDWGNVDREIRKQLRPQAFGSKHERLALEDVYKSMARGEGDVIEIDRQVPFALGVSGMVYIADAVATLKTDGKHTHRIYEPKGLQSLTYKLKRRIVELMYKHIEFVEVSE